LDRLDLWWQIADFWHRWVKARQGWIRTFVAM